MWCSHCRCEVTAQPSADAGPTRCAGCQTTLPGRDAQLSPTASALAADASLTSPASNLQRLLDDLELTDDLRRARRLLRIDPSHEERQPAELATRLSRQLSSRGPAPRGRKSREARRKRRGNSFPPLLWGGLTWLVVCAGGMGLTFGAGLLACTQFSHLSGLGKRDDLWNWGLLTALAGQFLLFLGCAFRWSSGRGAPRAEKLGRRAKPDSAPAQSSPQPRSPAAPLWSARCEAALGLSLDSLDRA